VGGVAQVTPPSAEQAGDQKARRPEHSAILRLVTLVERVGSVVLAVIAMLTFTSVFMRYVFNAPIPDAFDFSRLLMGVVILWGLAAASYYGEHIQFEALWSFASPKWKRIIDLGATLVTLGSVAVLSVMLAVKVHDSYLSHVTTSGLSILLWPFHLFAWIGAVLATLLLVARSVRLIAGIPLEDPEQSSADGA
jgi:TRAP-type C4-dicarboxylate transport system permease small subunit